LLRLAIGLLLSAAIGVSLGLIGGGGSVITLPVLVYVLGIDPHEAVAMSLAVVGSTALFSALLHHRQKNVDWRAGMLFAGFGVVAAFFGSRLTHRVSPPVLLLLFAGIMFVVATAMLLRGGHHEPQPHERSLWREAAAGLGVGFLTGFLGVGGGFLIVPALTFFGGLSMKRAVGTSLFVIAINCAAGLAGHLGKEPPHLRTTLLVTGVALAGAVLGTSLSHGTPPQHLRRVFAFFVIAVAVYLCVRNLPIVMKWPAVPG
jgi:uncharacterized membrane protein YfcA